MAFMPKIPIGESEGVRAEHDIFIEKLIVTI
jgi:hypothetical protein